MSGVTWCRVVLVGVVCFAHGCGFGPPIRYGQRVEDFPPAGIPNGASVSVVTNQRQIAGELIEVQDTGLVVLERSLLRFFPYTSVRSIRIEPTDRNIGTGSQPLDPRRREEVRLLSRFPQGLSPGVLEQLLAVYGQTQIEGEGP